MATAGLRAALTSSSLSTSGRGLAPGTVPLPRPSARPLRSPHGQVGRRARGVPARVWPFDLAWGTNLNLDSQVERESLLERGTGRGTGRAMACAERERTRTRRSGCTHASPTSILDLHPFSPLHPHLLQQIAGDLFAASIFPYGAFLWFAHKSGRFPPLTMFGFYFLLVFVAGSIPAGIYAKLHYHDILANVDWLHGGAESLLTLTNLFIVLGLRAEIRRVEADNAARSGEE